MAELQRVLIEQVHIMSGTYPDVPFAPNVDAAGIEADNRDAETKPFYVTLPLGEVNQRSRNNRRYINEVAIKAIYDAITQHAATGLSGHTRPDDDGFAFNSPILHWVGALIDENGVVWGKAYVPHTEPKMREYYRMRARTNGRVGTSLQGNGLIKYNSDDDIYDVVSLEIAGLRIDAVDPDGTGIPLAGSRAPHITHESFTEGALAGRLTQIVDAMTDEDMPRADLIAKMADAANVDTETVDQILRGDIEKPSLEQLQAFAQVIADDGEVGDLAATLANLAGYEDEEDEADMATTPNSPTSEKETPDVDSRIIEMREAHQTEVRELKLQVQTLQSVERDLKRVREALGIAPEADIVLEIQQQKAKADAMEALNHKLTRASIAAAVAEKVKIEKLRPMVVEMVVAQKPLTEEQITTEVNNALKNENVKLLLEWGVEAAQGPAQTTPSAQPVPAAKDGNKPIIEIPEVKDE